MGKILRDLWNMVLTTITILAALGFFVSACCVDSDSWVPLIVCGGCLVWLMLFGLANGGMEV